MLLACALESPNTFITPRLTIYVCIIPWQRLTLKPSIPNIQPSCCQPPSSYTLPNIFTQNIYIRIVCFVWMCPCTHFRHNIDILQTNTSCSQSIHHVSQTQYPRITSIHPTNITLAYPYLT